MGFAEPCFSDSDEDIARMAFRREDPRARDLDWIKSEVSSVVSRGYRQTNL